MTEPSSPPAVAPRLVPKPRWVDALDARIGAAVPLHPNAISLMKLLVVTPLMAAALRYGWGPFATTGLFLAFAALDALDGVVARVQNKASRLGRVIDRATDLPFLALVVLSALPFLDVRLVVAKLALDGLLLVLFVVKGTTTENRIRSTIADTTLLATLFISQGVFHPFVTVELVNALLWVNVAFTAVIGLFNAGALQKRFIADALSGANALCGLWSIWFAIHHKPELCLLLLLVGAGFDGLDGAAARRWGGTRFGVFSDDIADAINYAIAPGVAVAVALSGFEGTVVGTLYSVLTLSRLVFFTLNKSHADPDTFSGVPSTIGGVVALCALILFPTQPAIVGALVGIAVVLMVSFDSSYRHLGRWLFSARGAKREATLLAIASGFVLIAGGLLVGPRGPVAVVLAMCLGYGFFPQLLRFKALLGPRPSGPQPEDS